jgi:molecular chaperone GrpE
LDIPEDCLNKRLINERQYMAKKDDSQNEIHVETHSESHVSSGSHDQSDRIAELTADLQRIQADFVNFRRRADAEKADVFELAKTRIVRDFLAVRDSFDQELAHRPATVDAAWASSIDSIRTQFDQVLKSLGVERFDSKGQRFDPHRHEAIAMEDGDGPDEVVSEEMQPGYMRGDHILRHAIVKVGKATLEPSAEPAPEIEAPGEANEVDNE